MHTHKAHFPLVHHKGNLCNLLFKLQSNENPKNIHPIQTIVPLEWEPLTKFRCCLRLPLATHERDSVVGRVCQDGPQAREFSIFPARKKKKKLPVRISGDLVITTKAIKTKKITRGQRISHEWTMHTTCLWAATQLLDRQHTHLETWEIFCQVYHQCKSTE